MTTFASLFYDVFFSLIPFPALAMLIGLAILLVIAYISNLPREASLMLGFILVFSLLGFSSIIENIYILLILGVGLLLGFTWISFIKHT